MASIPKRITSSPSLVKLATAKALEPILSTSFSGLRIETIGGNFIITELSEMLVTELGEGIVYV